LLVKCSLMTKIWTVVLGSQYMTCAWLLAWDVHAFLCKMKDRGFITWSYCQFNWNQIHRQVFLTINCLKRSDAWMRACIALETSEIQVGSRKLQNLFISYWTSIYTRIFHELWQIHYGKKERSNRCLIIAQFLRRNLAWMHSDCRP